jgi:hypothetical protein
MLARELVENASLPPAASLSAGVAIGISDFSERQSLD